MNEFELKNMLNNLITGDTSINQVIHRLKNSIFRTTELDYAQPDHHRELRHGLNEVIYGQNKTIEQILQIALQLSQHQRCVLISRLNAEKLCLLKIGRAHV